MPASQRSDPTIPVHILKLAADKGFVNFDSASFGPAELGSQCAGLESESQAMQHEPCGLLSYADSAVNLPRTNAILAAN